MYILTLLCMFPNKKTVLWLYKEKLNVEEEKVLEKDWLGAE